MSPEFCELLEGPYRDPVVNWIRFGAWIDNPEVIETQVLQPCSHGSGDLRRFHELEFSPIATTTVHEVEIDLRTAMGRPEEGLSRSRLSVIASVRLDSSWGCRFETDRVAYRPGR